MKIFQPFFAFAGNWYDRNPSWKFVFWQFLKLLEIILTYINFVQRYYHIGAFFIVPYIQEQLLLPVFFGNINDPNNKIRAFDNFNCRFLTSTLDFSRPVVDREAGRVFQDPPIEFLAARTYLAGRFARRVMGPSAMPPADMMPRFGDWFRSFVWTGRARRYVTSEYWRALPRDLLPPLLFWSEQAIYVLRRFRSFLSHR